MPQNLITLTLTDEQLAATDNAITLLEQALVGLIALHGNQRKGIPRMGAKSEQFCRQTLGVMCQNPHIIPSSFGLPEGVAKLTTLDRLRPRLQRLQQLIERAEDSETALGSDIMALCLDGYGLLKVAGRNQGLEALRKSLSGRFVKTKPASGTNGTTG